MVRRVFAILFKKKKKNNPKGKKKDNTELKDKSVTVTLFNCHLISRFNWHFPHGGTMNSHFGRGNAICYRLAFLITTELWPDKTLAVS